MWNFSYYFIFIQINLINCIQVAKKDDIIRKCYKLLAAIHSNSLSIITSVKQTGTIGREIKDLEEQVYGLIIFYNKQSYKNTHTSLVNNSYNNMLLVIYITYY